MGPSSCQFTSSLQRQKSVERYPYNFIFAVQKKLKAGQDASKNFSSNIKNDNLKLKHNTEYKPNKYCIQTTTFLLQASRPILESPGFSIYIDIKLNMHFIILIPQFQLIIQNKPTKFPIYWKRPRLVNVLNALRERLDKGVDLCRTCIRNSTKMMITEDNTKIKTAKRHLVRMKKEIFASDETYSKSLINLLRLRKKILIDRTITLISWLEVQLEQVKSENHVLFISKIREKQESLLFNFHKERQYINRLLRRYKNKKVVLPSKKHSEPKESDKTVVLRGFQDDYYSCFPCDLRKEPKIKFLSITDYWKYKELYYFWWRYVFNKHIGNIEYFNLCLWILNRVLHKDSIILKLFPQNYDIFNMIQRHWKTLKDNAIELEIHRFWKNKCDSQESGETQIVIGSVSSYSTQMGINNLMETLKSSKNLNEFIPLSQDTETQDELGEIQNQPQLPRILGSEIPNKLSSPTHKTDFDKKNSSILERINEDVIFELLGERSKLLGQVDSSNTLKSLSWLRTRHKKIFNNAPNFFLKRSQSSLKWDCRNHCDHIEKIIIYQLYNEDVQWENMYAITGEVLEALVDELIIQHIKRIAKFVISG